MTILSASFAEILGSTVRDRRKGEIDVWIEAGLTLTIAVTPSEVEALCAYIEETAA